jgi:hypothetical protein
VDAAYAITLKLEIADGDTTAEPQVFGAVFMVRIN